VKLSRTMISPCWLSGEQYESVKILMPKKPESPAPLIGASLTHTGLRKENNEDAIMLHIPQSANGTRLGLLMIADGIGGHLAGEIPSQIAIDTVHDALADVLDAPLTDVSDATPEVKETLQKDQLASLVKQTIEKANRTIYDYAQQHWEQASNLGTTATCGLVYNDLLIIGHVGDSRAYRLRQGDLEQLTEDHTFVGEMVRHGQFSSEAFYDHPKRHVIIRALGQKPEVQVDIKYFHVQPGDRLLFCTDGVWEMVRDEQIKNILSSAASPQEAVERLFSSAMEAGGVDNIGVVVGEIHDR
jgi:serine/threonine protein phosphatase PrpC